MSDKSLTRGTKLNSQTDTYTIIEVIGSGGFGITYKASVPTKMRNIMTKAYVAIKEHFPAADCERQSNTSSISYSSTARKRVLTSLKEFINEAKCLQQIGGLHPNIVNVNEVFEANNTAYYVMEYIEGETLKQYVKSRGPISLKETLSIMMPVIEAVATLHKNRFTHLDIKPSNIMLATDEEGNLRPVLIDFGLAKHYNPDGSATSTMIASGFSEGYAPVEQYSGISHFSPQVDVYSLAATILFCLTGKTPPRSVELTTSTLYNAIPANVPAKLKRLLMFAMAFQATDRLPNANQLFLNLLPIAKEQGAEFTLSGVSIFNGGTLSKADSDIDDSTKLADDSTRFVDETVQITAPKPPKEFVSPVQPDDDDFKKKSKLKNILKWQLITAILLA
ncbi:MAG: serine/threonine protein kinase, partial [Bacteroides sp.]|nr:serine/threonine protein kinase [Bacteroides sp.]